MATKEDIQAKNNEYSALYSKKDLQAMANLYTTDCKFFPPGANKEFCGHEGIKEVLKMFLAGAPTLKMEALEVVSCGENYLWEEGRYTTIKEDGEQAGQGLYLVVWKKVNGEWKLHRDFVN